ncbi:hypothetical protein [Borreliella garinii]
MLRGEYQHNVIKSAVRGLLEIMEGEKRNIVFLSVMVLLALMQ